ncbi:hypothetical protein ACYATP_00470 [Lactobacillaceae bacterium Melli_B4]
MKPIRNDHFKSDDESLTRSEYRKRYRGTIDASDEPVDNDGIDLHATDFSGDESLSRQKLRQDKQMMDEEMKRKIADRKSKRLARRLDLAIGLLILGIVIVLIVLFFVN